ncbi:hypothetical protein ACF3DV_20125 [Chlorogloeopsis fritschii PCC 9212]|uniref:Uncharacterized protein n=1 Tax=Chlorogloeopsis fritschii PCC 6912 TaxID=211165 RepID=A0A433NN35_CHLFR|nr:hypothetical protein [Chlorogloeopsis fritschii]RUR84609.1 hypothetical protein PCC6912_15040 [Chlorogloeopsis fritschii PCC 6912]
MKRNTQQRLQTAVDVHRANILKSLEHRLQVAKTNGDENLLRQLEAEKTYYN